MTPLITQMAWALREDPTDAVWFDIAELSNKIMGPLETVTATRILRALKNPLPFPDCAIVGVDLEGNKFSVGVTAGNAPSNDKFKTEGVLAGGQLVDPAGNWRTLDLFVFYPETVDIDAETVDMHFFDRALESNELAVQHRAVTLAAITYWMECINADPSMGYIATKKANHIKRVRQGKLPLFDWRTVVVEPPRQKFPHQGGTHATPRQHDVRGHWVNRNGKRFWRKPHKRGDASLGVVFHDYKIKPTVRETHNESL